MPPAAHQRASTGHAGHPVVVSTAACGRRLGGGPAPDGLFTGLIRPPRTNRGHVATPHPAPDVTPRNHCVPSSVVVCPPPRSWLAHPQWRRYPAHNWRHFPARSHIPSLRQCRALFRSRTLIGATFCFHHRPLERSQHLERMGKFPAQLLRGQPHPDWFNRLGWNRFQRPRAGYRSDDRTNPHGRCMGTVRTVT